MSDLRAITQIRGLEPEDPAEAGPGTAPPGTDPLEQTRKGEGALASGAVVVFEPPLDVRVERVSESGDSRDVGRGQLLDPLVVGQIFRVSTEGGFALVTTPVTELRARGREAVEARTGHATYRLTRVAASDPSAQPPTSEPQPFPASVPPDPGASGTRSVALESAPEPGSGGFGVGMRVRVSRIDAMTGGLVPLGRGRLLESVRVGASLRFALDGDAAMVTSAVRRIEPVGDALSVETGNTTYRVERLSELP
jgi:hypothetical protein